jgi:acetyltransferase-like isoleucine patch superfamily enzyme
MLGTCSIINPKDHHVTFARDRNWLNKLIGCNLHLKVYVPMGIDRSAILSENISLQEFNYSEYEFARLHNVFNLNREPAQDIIGQRCNIHPSSIVYEGIHVAVGPEGKKIQLKHMGNVIFGDDVYVGALSLIERGVFDSTIIGNGVKVDGLCVIGHNCVIGENMVCATGTHIGGSSIIGKNCWFGTNSTVRAPGRICDNVVVGCGAVVVKDITEPGIYAGNPAKWMKPIREGWNF